MRVEWNERTRYPLLLAVLLAGCLAVMLAFTLARALPYSNAGLYLTMSDALARHRFTIPWRVPWYVRGGVPFAYPPLAFYLMAVVTHLAGVPRMRYLETIPPLFSALTAVPLYLFYRDLLGSARQALVGVAIACTGPSFLYMYAVADGSVRAVAAFFTACALLFCWRALQQWSLGASILGSIALACTLATHLENGFFAFLSLGLFALLYHRSGARIARAATMAAGAIVLTAPWWLLVFSRFGAHVFIDALGSHENPSSTSTLSVGGLLISFIAAFVRLLISGSGVWGVYLLSFIGLWYVRRRTGALVPVWLALSLLLLPHGDRHWALVMGAAAPAGIDAVVVRVAPSRARARAILRGAVIPFALLLGLAHVWWYMGHLSSGLTADDLRVTRWLRSHTPPSATVFVAEPYEIEGEWYPYLTHRLPAIPLWGTEFTGAHDRQLTLFYRQVSCTQHGSMGCIVHMIARAPIAASYLVERPAEFHSRDAGPLRAAGWRRVDATRTIAVWRAP